MHQIIGEFVFECALSCLGKLFCSILTKDSLIMSGLIIYFKILRLDSYLKILTADHAFTIRNSVDNFFSQ